MCTAMYIHECVQALADEDGLPSLLLLIRSKLLLARVLSPAAATLLVNAGTPLEHLRVSFLAYRAAFLEPSPSDTESVLAVA